jgi:hypothetical protein
MKKIWGVFWVVAGALLAAYGTSAAAQVMEVEPNYPYASAQALTFDASGAATVGAFLGSGDADFFSFYANAGDEVTVDINNGAAVGVDTWIGIHYPEKPADPDTMPLTLLDWNDDGPDGSPDSYKVVVIPANGIYFVSVVGWSNTVTDGGTMSGGPGNTTGTYTLVVSGVTPASSGSTPDSEPTADPEPEPSFPVEERLVTPVRIDIKPERGVLAHMDTRSRHAIPVVLYSLKDFDVRSVDVGSLTFGKTGDEQSLRKCNKHFVDVNHDRRPDLLCFFENHMAGFEPSSEVGILRGTTKDTKKPFEGQGTLKVIPVKRKHRHESRGRDRDDDRGRRHRDR